MEMPQVRTMLESDQPEYYRFPTSIPPDEDITIIIPGPYDAPFWNLLLQLVVRGELSMAWTLLSHHSTCRRAREKAASFRNDDDDDDEERDISLEGEGFETLHDLLLSAPLPGGRGDRYCDDAGLDDYLDEVLLEQEEEEEKKEKVGALSMDRRQRQQEDERDGLYEHAEDPGDIDFVLIDGVSSNSYLLWEALPRHANKLRTLRYRRDLRRCGRTVDDNIITGENDSWESPMVPELYQARVALNAFRIWQDTIRDVAFPAGIGSSMGHSSTLGGRGVAELFRRFPPLQQIMSILVGMVPPSIANYSSLSWSDNLLMELLYSRPDILPEDIAVRAKVAMGAGGVNQKNSLEGIILSIMQGSAGQVIETMFSVCGGSSGAALPATMASVFCAFLRMLHSEDLIVSCDSFCSHVSFFSRCRFN